MRLYVDFSKFWDFFKRKVCEVSAGWSICDRVYKISDGDWARMIDTACLQSTCRDDLHDTRHDAMITLRSLKKLCFPITLHIFKFKSNIKLFFRKISCYNYNKFRYQNRFIKNLKDFKNCLHNHRFYRRNTICKDKL